MRLGILWAFLPEELLALALVVAVFGVMLGLLSGRAFFGLLALIMFLPIVAAAIEAILGELPPWVSLLVLAFVGVALLQGLVALFLGSQAAATMAGNLAADLVRLALRLMFFPLRVVGWAARAALAGFFLNGRGGGR